jgi:hypothetical protein
MINDVPRNDGPSVLDMVDLACYSDSPYCIGNYMFNNHYNVVNIYI